MPASLHSAQTIILVLILLFVSCSLQAETPSNVTVCDVDQGTSRPGGSFAFSAWVRRGNCVHAATSDYECGNILEATLGTLSERHAVEYSASASMLALLPTIGALFGAPTVEIWMLTTILPVGGVLAMLLSFGSSILPSKSDEYEEALARTTPNAPSEGGDKRKLRPNADVVKDIVLRHLNAREKLRLPRWKVVLYLAAMAMLFGAAQAGMIVVVLGSVYASWCQSQWWLHVWYFVVTTVTFVENWLNLPFEKQWRLYLTNVPYETKVDSGHVIRQYLDPNGTESDTSNVRLALRQLGALQCGSLSITGSTSTTQPRTSMLVILTTSYDKRGPPAWLTGLKFLFKAASITVFVFGTSVFAAVTLLAMPMVQMLLVLILGAGIGSRALATATVSSLLDSVPVLPVLTGSDDELYDVIRQIFLLQRDHPDFQIELDGHIFIQERRIVKRSPWVRRILGVFAAPYDVRNAVPKAYGYEEEPKRDIGTLLGFKN